MSLFRPTPTAPPLVEDRFNSASAKSAYALSTFGQIVAELDDANDDLSVVDAEVSAEIERLTALRTAAARQAEQNANVKANVQHLIAPPVEEV